MIGLFLISTILSVGISWLLVKNTYGPIINYNPSLNVPYDIQTKLKITLWTNEIEWIDLEELPYLINDNITAKIMTHIYSFQNIKLGLENYLSEDNTTTLFAFVHVAFIISKYAYNDFPTKTFYWRVEDKENTIVTNNLQLSNDGNTYILLDDITTHVNRLIDMPQRVDGKIRLSSTI